MKHTEGIWRFTQDRTKLLSFDKKNEFVRVLDTASGEAPLKCDATLIESAPAMLAMLKRVLKNLKEYQSVEYYFLVQEIEEVISKADSV